MKLKRGITLVLTALMVFLSMTACGNKQVDQQVPSGEVEEQANNEDASVAEHDGNIIVALHQDIASFDPQQAGSIVNALVLENMYDRLFENNRDLLPEPSLAEEVTWNGDQEMIIKIHEGVMFSNGEEMTAEDVQFSLLRAKDLPVTQSLMAPIKTVDIVDEYTVKISLDSIYPSVTTALGHVACSILPKSYLEEVMKSDDWSSPIGSGRYTLESRVIGDSIKLVKNPNYWNQEDAALNDSLTFKVVPEGSTRMIMVETGEVDLNTYFETTDYERVVASDSLELHEYNSSTMYSIWLDNDSEYLDNKLVRQAINYAVDRQAVIDGGYDGLATPLFSYVGPTCLGYVENPGNYSYDPEKAKELLAEAGYPDGVSIELMYPSGFDSRVTEIVQAYLAQVGIQASITQFDVNQLVPMASNGELPTCVATWGCYYDPDLFMARIYGREGHGAWNTSHFSNDEFEELLVKGRSTMDETERAKYYEEAQALLAEEAVWCPLFSPNMYAVSTKGLQGVVVSVEYITDLHLLHY